MLRTHRGRKLRYKSGLGLSYRDQAPVFPGPFGGPLGSLVLTRNFETLAKNAGYPGVRLPDLRHGQAAGPIKAEAHSRVIQEPLGHASAAFTQQVYGQLSAGLQSQAANAFAKLMSEEVG